MQTSAAAPEIEIQAHTDCGPALVDWLAAKAPEALELCLASPGGDRTESPLPGLARIDVALVSDEAIASVHGEFLDDPTPTDVITFHHGEILISLDTARAAAPEAGASVEEECLLYLVHGLLHLNGHSDVEEGPRALMHRTQERLLALLLRRHGAEAAPGPVEPSR